MKFSPSTDPKILKSGRKKQRLFDLQGIRIQDQFQFNILSRIIRYPRPGEGRHVRVAIGADHAGYVLKESLIELLKTDGLAVVDLGTDSEDPVDYPDYAAAVGNAVRSGEVERGIIVCGSGAGASIAANKLAGVRAALAHDTYTAHQAVEHDDANVLCLGSRVIGPNLATELVRAFLAAEFSGEQRHLRRLGKIMDLEANG